ncbi:MAG: hypothetical protein F4X02_11005 [Chloroflexi bacterium]|nr:hypothetical protein [Chloroflexota bacterium]
MNTAAKSTDLREDAQLVIDVLSEKENIQLDYSADSVSWLDAYIEEHRAQLDEREKSLLQEKFGAFFGESIRHNYGGRWVKVNSDRWMIVFDEERQMSPFEIIGEHLDHHIELTEVFEHLPDYIHARRN